jgi:hypothetical protein
MRQQRLEYSLKFAKHILHIHEKEEVIGQWKETVVIQLVNRNKMYCRSFKLI